MSKLSLDKFLMLLERSKLVEPDQLTPVIADWKRQASLAELDDAQFCADHLVETGVLTDWQRRKLLEGRYRGFFLGKYKLLAHLGSGGMSSVYLAEHVLMQRRVAVKVLPQNRVADSSYLARFHFEAQAAAALDHRNIVRAYDLDNEGRIHYLVMEYVEGRDLHALVSQDGPLDYHTAANYITQAATGLDHAHHAGMVHRDIKPANILVDLKGTVKILDMGLAKFTAGKGAMPGFSQEEHVLGTADYLAPEQAVNSQTVDHRADIYAMGCTLYFLLTGHPPFATGTPMERMAAHQQQVPPSILLDRPDAPSDLLAICRKMMEKSAENRYQSAAEVCDALQAWLDNEAAFGRVQQTLVAVQHRSSTSRRSHEQAGSKINIVSGSASDLHSPIEPARLSSPLQDTDPNLHRATVRFPTRVAEPKGTAAEASPSKSQVLNPGPDQSGGSAVLSHENFPTPPPIVAPPSNVWQKAIWLAPAQATHPAQAGSSAAPDEIKLPLSIDESVLPLRGSNPRVQTSWIWTALLSAMILLAILLGLVAISN